MRQIYLLSIVIPCSRSQLIKSSTPSEACCQQVLHRAERQHAAALAASRATVCHEAAPNAKDAKIRGELLYLDSDQMIFVIHIYRNQDVSLKMRDTK